MLYTLSNDKLIVEISSVGAELQSIKYQNVEYLWQGDKTYWGGRAYNLFPICGRLTAGKYNYNGKEYEMNLHGFLRKRETEATVIAEDEIDFKLATNEEIYSMYPFDFEYHIRYKLVDTKIQMNITVENKDDKTMYFALGGHPGFNVPLENGVFTDYYLEFEKGSNPYGLLLSDTCYTTNDIFEIKQISNNKLPLTHDLFDRDAIIVAGLKSPICLKNKLDNRQVIVDIADEMKYVGLWHAPKTEAPYVCIEPWTSVPAYDNIVDDLETKRDMFKLSKNQTYNLEWSITVK